MGPQPRRWHDRPDEPCVRSIADDGCDPAQLHLGGHCSGIAAQCYRDRSRYLRPLLRGVGLGPADQCRESEHAADDDSYRSRTESAAPPGRRSRPPCLKITPGPCPVDSPPGERCRHVSEPEFPEQPPEVGVAHLADQLSFRYVLSWRTLTWPDVARLISARPSSARLSSARLSSAGPGLGFGPADQAGRIHALPELA